MNNRRKLLYALLALFSLLLIVRIVLLFFAREDGEYSALAAWLGLIGSAAGVLFAIVCLKERKK